MHLKDKSFLFSCLFLIAAFVFSHEHAFAETKSFTVADGSYERIYFDLNKGDEVSYVIGVSGVLYDDIEFTIYYPDGSNDGGGRIDERYSGVLVAHSSGRYVFEFDNTFSLISNKNVAFSYEITKNTYYVYADELPDYAKGYASNALYKATEAWKKVFPKKQFYVAETEDDADILIQWVRDFGHNEHVGFQYVRLIEVGLGDSNCYGEWKPYSEYYVTYIMAHEIGHALGLGHSDNPDALMYQYTNVGVENIYSSPCISPQSIQRTSEVDTISKLQTDSGGCLIATATFGSELAPQVQKLRELRDNTVLMTKSGTVFMHYFNQFYYLFSPTIADWERQNLLFKEAVKLSITPLLSSFAILNYADIDSEEEMLGYGIGIILLNVGIYFIFPAILVTKCVKIQSR